MARQVGLIFDLAVDPSTKQELEGIERQLFEVAERLKQARREGDKDTFAKLRNQQKALRQELVKVNGDFRKQVRTFQDTAKAAKVPNDSIAGLRIRYRELRKELDSVSKSDPKFDEMAKQARFVKKELEEATEATGDFRDQIGNYRKGALQLGDLLTGGLVTGGITAFAAKGVQLISNAAETISQFEQQLKQLQSVTGATEEDLQFLSDAAINLSTKFGRSAKEVVEAYQLIASARPELLQNAEALAEVTKQAEILAVAGRITLPDAGEALARFLNQMGADTQDAAKFVDILATSQQKGTATISQLSASYKNAGSVIKSVGLNFEEGNALLQGLAKGAVVGEEGGTKLRNILLELAATGEDRFNPAVVGINKVLENLSEEVTDVTAAQEFFGKQNAAAALTLIQNRDVVEDLNGKLNDYGNALAQAENNTDTFQGQIRVATQEWNAFVLSVEDGNGVISRVLKEATSNFSGTLRALRGINEGDVGIFDFLTKGLGSIGKELREQDALAEKGDEFVNRIKNSIENLVKSTKEQATETRKAVLTFSELQAKQSELRKEIQNAVIAGKPYAEQLRQYNDITRRLSQAQDIFKGKTKEAKDETDKFAELINRFNEKELQRFEKAMTVDAVNAWKEFNDSQDEGIRKLMEARKALKEFTEQTFRQDVADNTEQIDANIANLELQQQAQIKLARERITDEERLNEEIERINNETQIAILNERLGLAEVGSAEYLRIQNEIAAKEGEIFAKIEEDKLERKKRALEQGFRLAESIAIGIVDIEEAQFDRETEARKAALQEQLDQGVISREEFDEQTEEIERAAAERRKELAKKEAIIQGALAVVKTFATLGFLAGALPALLVGAETAIQLALIEAQQFADSGKVVKPVNRPQGLLVNKKNIPTLPNGDNIFATLAEGEVILNKRHQKHLQDIAGADVFQRIKVPGFQTGGLVGQSVPQVVRPPSQFAESTTTAEIDEGVFFKQAEIIAAEVAARTSAGVQQAIKQVSERQRQLDELFRKLNV